MLDRLIRLYPVAWRERWGAVALTIGLGLFGAALATVGGLVWGERPAPVSD